MGGFAAADSLNRKSQGASASKGCETVGPGLRRPRSRAGAARACVVSGFGSQSWRYRAKASRASHVLTLSPYPGDPLPLGAEPLMRPEPDQGYSEPDAWLGTVARHPARLALAKPRFRGPSVRPDAGLFSRSHRSISNKGGRRAPPEGLLRRTSVLPSESDGPSGRVRPRRATVMAGDPTTSCAVCQRAVGAEGKVRKVRLAHTCVIVPSLPLTSCLK